MRLVVALRGLFERRHRRLVCREAVELMTDYLEGGLEPAAEARYERHLARCTACTAYLEQMRATIATLGHLRTAGLPPAVLDGLIEVYRRHRT